MSFIKIVETKGKPMIDWCSSGPTVEEEQGRFFRTNRGSLYQEGIHYLDRESLDAESPLAAGSKARLEAPQLAIDRILYLLNGPKRRMVQDASAHEKYLLNTLAFLLVSSSVWLRNK